MRTGIAAEKRARRSSARLVILLIVGFGGAAAAVADGASAQAASALVASPSTLTFTGSVGSSLAPQTVMVTNQGTDPIQLTSLNLDGTDPGDFGFENLNGCGVLPTVSPGQQCQFTIKATETSASGTATLDIYSTDPGSPLSIPLTLDLTPAPPPKQHLHRCSNPGLRGISNVMAGTSAGGDPRYAAQCQGVGVTLRVFVASRCAEAHVAFRPVKSPELKYAICYDQYDATDVLKRISRTRAIIGIVPTHNLNALIEFEYRFTR